METEEEITTRHRKEKKDLQGKIQAMKKNAGKKNKKEVHTEIEKLEKELETKHLEELKNLSLNDNNESTEPQTKPASQVSAATPASNPEEPRLSKAQKRRDKKSEKERERQREIELESENMKDHPREVESNRIKDLLQTRNLSLYPIAADGDCLYSAISHQLKQTGRTPMDVKELRNITADYIRENKSNLLPYMTNPDTDEGLNDDEFEEYCEKLRNTKCWGGQVEIMALSNALKVPIEVLQAHGPPTLQSEDSFKEPNLILTYHRHFVSLGEHYNSTQQLVSVPDEED